MNLEKLELLKIETTFFEFNDPNFDFIGRFEQHKNSSQGIWPGVYIEFGFEGSEFDLILHQHTLMAGEHNFFNLWIDEKLHSIFEITPEQYKYNFSFNEGKHHIKLIKRTEARCGMFDFYGVSSTKNAKLFSLENKKQACIEFIGDSITCGYGNEGPTGDFEFKSKWENAQKAFGIVCAENLNAQYRLTSFSGRGLLINFDGTKKKTMNKMFFQTHPFTSDKWNFSNNPLKVPEITVINLGINDFAGRNINEKYKINHDSFNNDFTLTFIKFLTDIKKLYSATTFIIVDGPIIANRNQIDSNNYQELLDSICQNFIVHNPKTKCYRYSMTVDKNPKGTKRHPCTAHSKINGLELANFIRNKNII